MAYADTRHQTRRVWAPMQVTSKRLCAIASSVALAFLTCASSAGAATKTISGSVGNGSSQVFSFMVTSADPISATISYTSQTAVLTVAIVDPTGKQVALTSSKSNPKTVSLQQPKLLGTYKVRVK